MPEGTTSTPAASAGSRSAGTVATYERRPAGRRRPETTGAAKWHAEAAQIAEANRQPDRVGSEGNGQEDGGRRDGQGIGAEENRELGELAKPEEFADDYVTEERQRQYLPDAETLRRGARAGTVEGVLASACAGWKREPTSTEFHEAVQAKQPTRRQRLIVATVAIESTWVELVKAHLEGAFTWRQLVRGLQAWGWCPRKRAGQINTLATAETDYGARMKKLVLPGEPGRRARSRRSLSSSAIFSLSSAI